MKIIIEMENNEALSMKLTEDIFKYVLAVNSELIIDLKLNGELNHLLKIDKKFFTVYRKSITEKHLENIKKIIKGLG